MIRSTALAAALAATLLVAAPSPSARAQGADAPGADTQEPAAGPRKRATTRAARRAAAKPAAPGAGDEAQAPAADEPAPAKGRRGASRRGRAEAAGKADAKAPPSLQASPVGTYGDWSVFAAGQGRTRICYAITQPQQRLPKSLKREAAYLFVTVRKAENVPNEVALMMGFPAKAPSSQTASAGGAATPPSNEPTLTIGAARYTLVVKEANAWLQNPADETRVVNEMARGSRVVVKAVSLRGNPSTDEYALTGFADAIRKAREECK